MSIRQETLATTARIWLLGGTLVHSLHMESARATKRYLVCGPRQTSTLFTQMVTNCSVPEFIKNRCSYTHQHYINICAGDQHYIKHINAPSSPVQKQKLTTATTRVVELYLTLNAGIRGPKCFRTCDTIDSN